MSEQLCLKRNDFQENIKSAFENLRENNDFADATLACEDGEQVEVHKLKLKYRTPTTKGADGKIPKPSFKGKAIPSTVENRTLAIPNNFSRDLEELEERVKSMMEKSKNKYGNRKQKASICKVCGKEGIGSAARKDHIETNHLNGIAIPCNHCDKIFRSRHSFLDISEFNRQAIYHTHPYTHPPLAPRCYISISLHYG